MIEWIQTNYGWILAFGGVTIAIGKVLLNFRDKIKKNSEDIDKMSKTICEEKNENGKKFKMLEDSFRSRDEVILNKLDNITLEMKDMNVKNAKLIGILEGKGILSNKASEDI